MNPSLARGLYALTGPALIPAERQLDIALLYRLWNFPSLDKEGWRVAPGWFETVIPQVRQERYSCAIARTCADLF